jgi:hypothetical protein
MRNVADKVCSENQNSYFVLSTFFFENRAVCEKIWKNIVERGRPHDNIARAHCMLDT